mmetsp:Transcript_45685/g.99150  ORF Transcript_45685/g.99150 Transcript_45685/m.99150 type:complete len:459 (-) Transcript_45685:155-1531(-)
MAAKSPKMKGASSPKIKPVKAAPAEKKVAKGAGADGKKKKRKTPDNQKRKDRKKALKTKVFRPPPGFELVQLKKAIAAVKKCIDAGKEKQQAEAGASSLFEEAPVGVQIRIQRARPTEYYTGKKRPAGIELPHPPSTADSEVCLLVKDPQRAWKDAFAREQNKCPVLKKIIGLTKLQANYKTPQQLKALAMSFDHFLVDKSIMHFMSSTLGRTFYKLHKAKKPVPVSLPAAAGKATKCNEIIEEALRKTYLWEYFDSVSTIRIGLGSQTEDELFENAKVVLGHFQKLRCSQENPILSVKVVATNNPELVVWRSEIKEILPPLTAEEKVERATPWKLSVKAKSDRITKAIELRKKQQEEKKKSDKAAGMGADGDDDDDDDADNSAVEKEPPAKKAKVEAEGSSGSEEEGAPAPAKVAKSNGAPAAAVDKKPAAKAEEKKQAGAGKKAKKGGKGKKVKST